MNVEEIRAHANEVAERAEIMIIKLQMGYKKLEKSFTDLKKASHQASEALDAYKKTSGKI